MQETSVWILGQEDPLEEGMATHSSILAWIIPMDRGAWQATVHGVAESQTWLRNEAQHSIVYRSTIYNNQDIDAVLMSIASNVNI